MNLTAKNNSYFQLFLIIVFIEQDEEVDSGSSKSSKNVTTNSATPSGEYNPLLPLYLINPSLV